MRYFGKIAYNGTSFVGWQNQPNGVSVQETIERAIFILLREEIKITGCGRTDTAVHASCYFFHFDVDLILIPEHFVFKLNSLLPESIYISELLPVHAEAHARFDAYSRTYRYYIAGNKNPFKTDSVFWFRQFHHLDFEKVIEAAAILEKAGDFFAFSRTNSDVKNFKCRLDRITWRQIAPDVWVMEISANRFLRGMVRLIVGACINTGLGKVTFSQLEAAANRQIRLEKAWSVPAHGLYLADVKYPFLEDSSTEKAYFFEPFGPLGQ